MPQYFPDRTAGVGGMASSFEKSVKGGTKVKLAPPKTKYVEHILLATQSGEAGVAEVFRTLTHRLRDSTWTVVFKALIIVHLMIKEGAPDVTLRWLAPAPRNRLAINTFTDVQTQGQNIRHYSEYLLSRAQAFAAAKCDFVRAGEGRMKKLTVDKGLLRETELVQDQVRAVVNCDLLTDDVENEISLTAFRLLTRDLLDLYNVENEAVMNVLSRYFEMSRPDAERAIKIYQTFCKQTELVVQYLGVARQYEHATRLEIPKIKHAPTSLANSLQEYLDDKDFDVNRRQYLAEQEAKRSGKPIQRFTQQTKSQPAAGMTSASSQPAPATTAASAQPKGPAPDLIDFFESIEQNQQPMAQGMPQFQQQPPAFPMQTQQPSSVQQHPQMQQQPYGLQQIPEQTGNNGFVPNGPSTNPFGQPQQQQPHPIQTQFNGAGFGGYGPQPAQQQQPFSPVNTFGQDPQYQIGSPVQMQSPTTQIPMQAQPTGSTNPFRQSMMPTGSSFGAPMELQHHPTNPFARGTNTGSPAMPGNVFAQQAQQQQQQQQPLSPQQQPSGSAFASQPLQAQATWTNPFARSNTTASPPVVSPLQIQQTGSTNPFRQSMFVNQQTGTGWQNAPQATMGGLENLQTIPVFPRPGQGPEVHHHQQQSPWG